MTGCRARFRALSKVAPAKSDVHMEDVHRAGGIMAILGELNRAGLLNADLPTVHAKTLGDALSQWDISVTDNPAALELFSAAPGGVPTQVAFSQSARWKELDLDREKGVIRDAQHPFSKDGGLAVLKGNIAINGCIVKTAGVDESILKFSPAPPAYSKARIPRSRRSLPTRSRPAMSLLSAMKVPRAVRACRKCSIRPAI